MIFKNKELIKFYKKINSLAETKLFKDWDGEKVFLLRHDVDFDLNPALQMAELEYDNNIVSTYFILVSSESYNIFSNRNKKKLLRIKSLGHEIGLHFDPTNYDSKLSQAVEKEIESLSFITESKIKSISLHNPTSSGQYPIFENYINAYSPNYFKKDNYMSDSCFSFRGKEPMAFLEKISNGMIQILLHPMHYSNDALGYDKIVVNSFVNYMENIHKDFLLVNSKYRQQFGKDFLATFKRIIK